MSMPTYYTTAQVAKMFHRSPHTIGDWIRIGCPTPDGRRIRLRTMKLGKSWTIPKEAVAIFDARVRPRIGGPDLDVEDRSPDRKD